MEKISVYERKKDYSHIKDKYRKNSHRGNKHGNETFITLEEKVGLQLILCVVMLTALIVGKMFHISSITKFETTISRTLSNDSRYYIENTSFGKAIEDLGVVLKNQIGIEEDMATPTMSNTTDINDIDEKEYEDTVIEKK